MKSKLMKKIGITAAALALGAMMVVPAFADGSAVYAKFCKDGTTTVSMTQMAIDGAATVVDNGDGTLSVTLPLEAFTYTKWFVTATGKLTTLEIDNVTYTASYVGDTDNDGYENGTITFLVSSSNYVVNGSNYYNVSVEADLDFSVGSLDDMSSDVDLYFTTTQPVYNGSGD